MLEENRMEKWIKVIIIILIILIVCITLLLVNIQEKNINSNTDLNIDSNSEDEFALEPSNKLEEVKFDNEIMNIKDCIQKYIDNEAQGHFMFQKLEKKEITVDSIIYYAYGQLINDNKYINEANYTVKIDYLQNKFYIAQNIIENIQNVNKLKSYDEFSYKNYSQDEILNEQFRNFKWIMLNKPEKAFQMLDEDYKSKRFDDSIERFNEYLNTNKAKLENCTLIQYSEGIQKFYIEDQYKNIWVIIKNDNSFDYTVMLDNYTILDENYIQKYNSLSSESKVHTNIDIFIKMLNTKDYEHAYEKLDETFASNNFGTIENFVQYVENNFYENNLLTVNSVEQKNDVYIANINLRSNSSSVAQTMEKNFVVKLEEQTDFKMSFNIN